MMIYIMVSYIFFIKQKRNIVENLGRLMTFLYRKTVSFAYCEKLIIPFCVSGIDNVMKLLSNRLCYVVARIVRSSYFIICAIRKNIILFFCLITFKGLRSNTGRPELTRRKWCLSQKKIHMYIHNSYEKKNKYTKDTILLVYFFSFKK